MVLSSDFSARSAPHRTWSVGHIVAVESGDHICASAEIFRADCCSAWLQVEDMDLSLRSYVGGWKAIFLEDTTCLNELPASFFAYRKQQHRWTCGPVQLWRKTAYYIWHSNLPFHRKVSARLAPKQKFAASAAQLQPGSASAVRTQDDVHART